MKKQLLASHYKQPSPWARYQNTFTTLIKELGYAPGSIQNQTQLITRFGEWLRRRQTEIHFLDETLVQHFLRSQPNPSSVRRGGGGAATRVDNLSDAQMREISQKSVIVLRDKRNGSWDPVAP
jgi:hypothetical protein